MSEKKKDDKRSATLTEKRERAIAARARSESITQRAYAIMTAAVNKGGAARPSWEECIAQAQREHDTKPGNPAQAQAQEEVK